MVELILFIRFGNKVLVPRRSSSTARLRSRTVCSLWPDVVPEIRAASTRSNRLEISITPSHVAWRRGSRSGRLWTPSIGLSGPHGIWREPRREPRASHVGSVMPDEPLLREKAREAIRAAKLPSRRPDGTLGGLGFGGARARCAVSCWNGIRWSWRLSLSLLTRPLGCETLTTSTPGAIWCGSSSAHRAGQ